MVEIVGVTLTPNSDNGIIQNNESSSSVKPQVKIVNNQSERDKLDSEDNATIQEEQVPLKSLKLQ